MLDTEIRTPAPMQAKAARSSLLPKLVPYLLALFFLMWALRQVSAGNAVDTDAARHALNGAFIHDLVKNGSVIHPYDFGLHYYARLPALSLPYHPPLFPAAEALLFSIFGVSIFTARLAVALAVALSILLLFRLILATQRSAWIAALAVASFCFWRPAQAVAGDVMLEYPTMVLALAALWCIRDLFNGYPLSRGIWFALLGGAAVWTKQHAVFLGGVPFAWIVFSRSWKLLKEKTIWLSTALFVAEVVALGMLTLPFKGAGMDQVSPMEGIGEIFLYNLGYYRDCVIGSVGPWIPAAVVILFVVDWVISRSRPGPRLNVPLYWAWACCAFLILLLIGPYDLRYLFFTLPPVLVLVFTSLYRVGGALLGESESWVAPAAVGAVCAILGLRVPAVFTHGPSQAAEMLVKGTPQVVFYCGSTDGNFIFSVRERDPKLRTAVIIGEKLSRDKVSPGGFDNLARRYGISRIVLERSTRPQACDALRQAPTPSMMLDREIPLASSNPRWRGNLSVYTFKNPSRRSDGKLIVPVEKIGRDLELDLN
jgi:hypothetical protein